MDMHPTCRLRWFIPDTHDGSYAQTLQQWWETTDGSAGEWREIPVKVGE